MVQETAPTRLLEGTPVKNFTINQLMQITGTVKLNNTSNWIETLQDDILYLIGKGFGSRYGFAKWEFDTHLVGNH